MPERLEYRITLPLRWRDIDPLGHLNQAVYHELLEEGRAGLITAMVDRIGPEGVPGGLVVRHVDLDYHREVRKEHGAVEVVVRVAAVGASSVRLAHDVLLPGGAVAASGSTVLVGWDPATRGKRTISERERVALGV